MRVGLLSYSTTPGALWWHLQNLFPKALLQHVVVQASSSVEISWHGGSWARG